MFKVNIEQLVPRFLLNDKNGYAIAKAIEAGLQIMNDGIDQGVKCITDVDSMPEWRLDELAWEYNLLYDYTQDIEVKRGWIKDAIDTYSHYGTLAGLLKYLESIYDIVSVEEWFEYNGSPFHFRVNVSGLASDEENARALKAIDTVKNLRSYLDGIIFNSGKSDAELWCSGIEVCGIEVLIDSINLDGSFESIITSVGDVLTTDSGDSIAIA